MVLGLTQPLVKMSTRNTPGGKGGRFVRLTTSQPSRASWNPLAHTGPVTELLYLYLYFYPVPNFAEIFAVFIAFVHADRRTDRESDRGTDGETDSHTDGQAGRQKIDLTKVIEAFHGFVNDPKSCTFRVNSVCFHSISTTYKIYLYICKLKRSSINVLNYASSEQKTKWPKFPTISFI